VVEHSPCKRAVFGSIPKGGSSYASELHERSEIARFDLSFHDFPWYVRAGPPRSRGVRAPAQTVKSWLDVTSCHNSFVTRSLDPGGRGWLWVDVCAEDSTTVRGPPCTSVDENHSLLVWLGPSTRSSADMRRLLPDRAPSILSGYLCHRRCGTKRVRTHAAGFGTERSTYPQRAAGRMSIEVEDNKTRPDRLW
jgi:hypothetical protein